MFQAIWLVVTKTSTVAVDNARDRDEAALSFKKNDWKVSRSKDRFLRTHHEHSWARTFQTSWILGTISNLPEFDPGTPYNAPNTVSAH